MKKYNIVDVIYGGSKGWFSSIIGGNEEVAAEVSKEVRHGANIRGANIRGAMTKACKKLKLKNKGIVGKVGVSIDLYSIERGDVGVLKIKENPYTRKENEKACNMMIAFLQNHVKLNYSNDD